MRATTEGRGWGIRCSCLHTVGKRAKQSSGLGEQSKELEPVLRKNSLSRIASAPKTLKPSLAPKPETRNRNPKPEARCRVEGLGFRVYFLGFRVCARITRITLQPEPTASDIRESGRLYLRVLGQGRSERGGVQSSIRFQDFRVLGFQVLGLGSRFRVCRLYGYRT